MSEHPLDFTGKIVLVTGSGRGLGRGIAMRFAQAGAMVAVHYHTSRDAAEKTVRAIQLKDGNALAFQANLTVEDEVEDLIAQIEHRLGSVDVVVNNAGIYPVRDLVDMSAVEWDQVVNANLRSVFLVTRAAARCMITRSIQGAIVNIATVETRSPAFGHSHYDAAKAGVVMLTRSSALELGSHAIRVNAVSPGLIWREGIEQDWPEGVASWKASAPLGRLGTPDDVANACLFLASSAAGWITGANLVVDGGISCRPAF